MDTTVIDAKNPVEVRDAALRVLNEHLGQSLTQAFLRQYSGAGDFTKEHHEQPEPGNDEIFAGIMRLQEERIKSGKPFAGRGDFTAERQSWPDESIEEIAERLKKIDAERHT